MTATVNRPSAQRVETTDADIRLSVRRALRRAGNVTYDELAEQARHGDFDSMRARVAWLAVRDLRGFAE